MGKIKGRFPKEPPYPNCGDMARMTGILPAVTTGLLDYTGSPHISLFSPW